MYHVTIFVCALMLTQGAASAATAPTLSLGPDVDIGSSYGNPTLSQYQSDLRCDPNDARIMAVTCKLETTPSQSENETLCFSTVDGGVTWRSTRQLASSDPDVVFAPDGSLHWTFINNGSGKRLGYRRSLDHGLTWEATRDLSATVDHPHITCDRSGGPFHGSLYVAGRRFSNDGIAVLRSRDGGGTWQVLHLPLTEAPRLRKGFVYGSTVLVNGTLLIPIKTENTIIVTNDRYGGAISEVYMLRSTDGGVTFAPAQLIGSKNGPAIQGPGGAFQLANLVSGPWAGGQRIYLAWSQTRDQQPAVLVLSTSDDGGLTWSPLREVLQSAPTGWGVAGASLMCNRAGVLAVQWYSEPDFSTFDLYSAVSIDGGVSFTAPLRVSPETSTAPPSEARVPGQDQVYADAAADGSFRLVWTDARRNAPGYVLHTRTLNVQVADANRDGVVDAQDKALIGTNFGRSGSTITPAGADANGDGRVDAVDLGIINRGLGH